MKILLVGEYSRLHNSLKEGLQALGHEVTLIATGDLFKNYPADIKLHRNYDSGIGKKLKVGLFSLFKIDITGISLRKQFFKHKDELKGFDVVQLINESPFDATVPEEMKIIDFLSRNNKKLFLLSCGNDYISVDYAHKKKFRYSILSPYFEKKIDWIRSSFILKYLRPDYIKLHLFILEHAKGVIASDLDYHIPYEGHPNYLGLIPNPINLEKLKFQSVPVSDKIKIFQGVNRDTHIKKGGDYFDAALELLKEKHNDKIEIILVENLPYTEYIEKYNSAHIVLDVVLGYDQGYNALEAMAKGKIVFTGAEREWLEHYQLEEDTVAINALPNARSIFEKLEWFILNPSKISEISQNARLFVEKEHDYKKIAQNYIDTWNNAE